jgi:ubiquinone/menaquinone biosynthesis C-methylase UbiE
MTNVLQTFAEADWTLRESDTGYGPHGMHTWVAAMIPALARKLIQLTKPTKLLDPYCGGGTVCVEGIINNIKTTGVDANPLSVIITKAKTTPVDQTDVKYVLNSILDKVKIHKSKELFFPDYKEYRIRYWFKEEHLKYLDGLARAVAKINDKNLKTFFQCVFSATVRDVSLTYRNEIRLRRLEPAALKRFNRDVLETFSMRAIDSVNRLSILPRNKKSKIIQGDVKNLPFDNDEFSTIICSPPYGDERNGVPYFQFAKNMLYWLGVPKTDLDYFKTRVLGWYNKETIQEKRCPESTTLKELITKIQNKKQNVNEAIAFYSDYEKGLQEMARVTSDKIVIVIGNRVLNKQIVKNADITTELFENIGIKLIEHYKRDLPSKRIPRFGSLSKTVEGGQIDKEDILIYSKK